MLPYRMILALQSKFLPAFGVRPPVSSRRRTPKSHSFCSLHRSLRIFPLLTFNFQLSTFDRLFPLQAVPVLPGSPVTGHQPPVTSLCFHALTNCPFSIPFVLTFMHRMGGVPPSQYTKGKTHEHHNR